MHTEEDALKQFYLLHHFLGRAQKYVIVEGMKRGEESQYFIDKVMEISELIKKMPKTYEQEGKGGEAIAYLHYFYGPIDAYITEKDMETEQHQAFGMIDIGYGPEVGYISIIELLQNGCELDMHFTPKPLKELRK